MSYNPSKHQSISKPFAAVSFPLDARSLFFDEVNFKYRPYQNTAEVLAYLKGANPTQTAQFRRGFFEIVVNFGGTLLNGVITGGRNVPYWFADGVADADLVVKQEVTQEDVDALEFALSALTTVVSGKIGYSQLDPESFEQKEDGTVTDVALASIDIPSVSGINNETNFLIQNLDGSFRQVSSAQLFYDAYKTSLIKTIILKNEVGQEFSQSNVGLINIPTYKRKDGKETYRTTVSPNTTQYTLISTLQVNSTDQSASIMYDCDIQPLPQSDTPFGVLYCKLYRGAGGVGTAIGVIKILSAALSFFNIDNFIGVLRNSGTLTFMDVYYKASGTSRGLVFSAQVNSPLPTVGLVTSYSLQQYLTLEPTVVSDSIKPTLFNDIPVNTTTTSPTKSALNTAYPLAKKDFQVKYPLVTGGGKIAYKVDNSPTGDWQIITAPLAT